MVGTSALSFAASIKAGKLSVIEAVNNYINLIEKRTISMVLFLLYAKSTPLPARKKYRRVSIPAKPCYRLQELASALMRGIALQRCVDAFT